MTINAGVSLELLAGSMESLPSLPVVAARMLREVDDPHTNARRLATLAGSDPGLAATVLKLVNSAAYGLSRRVTTLDQAIALIGFDALRQLSVGVSVLDALKDLEAQPAGLDPDAFWEHSFTVACAARLLAPHCRVRQREEAFLAGLLHDVGKLLLAQFSAAPLADAMALAARRRRPLYRAEEEIMQTTHARMGGALAQHWRLPAKLVGAIRFHHGGLPDDFEYEDLRQMVIAVSMANHLAKAVRRGASGCPMRCSPDAVFQKLGIESQDARDRLLHALHAAVDEVRDILIRP